MEYSEQGGFDSYESSVIIDNHYNYHILSEEDIFTENIDPIIFNGVETIGGNILFQK